MSLRTAQSDHGHVDRRLTPVPEPIHLADRAPEVPAHALVAGLVPPPLFADVRF